MPAAIPIALAVSAVAAAATTVTGVMNYEAGQQAAKAQKDLANQQAGQLQQQEAQAQALAAQEATSGQTFGFDSTNHPLAGVMTGVGFGSAPKSSANAGSQSITGMG
jgi:hypothetical protein